MVARACQDRAGVKVDAEVMLLEATELQQGLVVADKWISVATRGGSPGRCSHTAGWPCPLSIHYKETTFSSSLDNVSVVVMDGAEDSQGGRLLPIIVAYRH
ncbi:hypothetical protein OPV22_020350 [Ensete ventricosum]|uniref:Uncharacterized protein n=1 Tax=Ensete ventricosum TaxID=4639 RepID=A0AAV8QPT7_ENSVE|nr:hypothetical protein OPV22_020350 [Ensete ventricosum]